MDVVLLYDQLYIIYNLCKCGLAYTKKLILLWICLDLICTSRPDFKSTYYIWQLHYTTEFFFHYIQMFAACEQNYPRVKSRFKLIQTAQTVSKTEVYKT